MAKPEDYRRYAAECLRLAQEFRGRAEAATLLDMAERWRRLAKEAEGGEPTSSAGSQGLMAKTWYGSFPRGALRQSRNAALVWVAQSPMQLAKQSAIR